jgi:hypothetical protein
MNQEMHPAWWAIQKARNQQLTKINPLELGHPFQFTDQQHAALQPCIRAAGHGGAVLVFCYQPETRNYLQAIPVALTAKDRATLTRTLTKIIKSNRKEKTK